MKRFKHIFAIGLLFAGLSMSAQVGNPAPDFTVTDTHGKTHRLYDLLDSGKVVILDFFYTTCGPCQFYSPQVNLAFEKYGCNTAKTFFMSIDYNDTNAEVLAYDQQFGIKYPSISGTQGGGNDVVRQYGIFAFPTFYVIDASKKIVMEIDPPTLQVFDYRFNQLGIQPAACALTSTKDSFYALRPVIFPDPVTDGILKISLSNDRFRHASFEIFDQTARLVNGGKLSMGGSPTGFIHVDNLPNGVYLLKLQSLENGVTMVSQFVKL